MAENLQLQGGILCGCQPAFQPLNTGSSNTAIQQIVRLVMDTHGFFTYIHENIKHWKIFAKLQLRLQLKL